MEWKQLECKDCHCKWWCRDADNDSTEIDVGRGCEFPDENNKFVCMSCYLWINKLTFKIK